MTFTDKEIQEMQEKQVLKESKQMIKFFMYVIYGGSIILLSVLYIKAIL